MTKSGKKRKVFVGWTGLPISECVMWKDDDELYMLSRVVKSKKYFGISAKKIRITVEEL